MRRIRVPSAPMKSVMPTEEEIRKAAEQIADLHHSHGRTVAATRLVSINRKLAPQHRLEYGSESPNNFLAFVLYDNNTDEELARWLMGSIR
ncbi:MAG: hypothetical protein JOY96_00920 [Verrucomicrobia bacterium]|nr:hypothetical protein [Verrucomicrobiota bacterium]MBV9674530.1 hypothetical protein [Verrucomicrobiota bacterium]